MSADAAELEAIKKVIGIYVDGAKTGKGDVMKPAFHLDATIFGYVCLQWDIQVMLLSPLWISPDKTRVYFLNFPQGNNPRYPLLEEMQRLLKDLETTYGFNAEHWVEIREELENGQRTAFAPTCRPVTINSAPCLSALAYPASTWRS